MPVESLILTADSTAWLASFVLPGGGPAVASPVRPRPSQGVTGYTGQGAGGGEGLGWKDP